MVGGAGGGQSVNQHVFIRGLYRDGACAVCHYLHRITGADFRIRDNHLPATRARREVHVRGGVGVFQGQRRIIPVHAGAEGRQFNTVGVAAGDAGQL